MKAQGLWACHLGPELGGQGYGQVKLALMNERLGRVGLAPVVFGCQAPDTGNAEIIAHYGTEQQKKDYLWPLLNNEITSGYSMTEPQGGSDPLGFQTSAVLDGKEWVINGEKWFTSGARNPRKCWSSTPSPIPTTRIPIGACRCSLCRARRRVWKSCATWAWARSGAARKAICATPMRGCRSTRCWASGAARL